MNKLIELTMHKFHVRVPIAGAQLGVVPHLHKLVLGPAALVPLRILHDRDGLRGHLVQELLEVLVCHACQVHKTGESI